MSSGAGVEVGEQLPRLTLPCFLSDIATRHGAREAIVFEGTRTSYAELERAAKRLGRALIAAGAGKGTRIAALMGSRPEWIELYLATALVGGIFIPLSTFAQADERDYVLRHSDAQFLFLQESLLQHRYLEELLTRHPELARGDDRARMCVGLPQLRRIVSIDPGPARAGAERLAHFLELDKQVPEALLDAVASEVTESDDAIVIYTSGTTARPKAVLHLQRAALINGLRFKRWMGLGPQDRVWTAQPFFWTAGITMSLIATLDAGGCLLLQESFDPERGLDMIERERATTVHAWAHQHKALGQHPSAAKRDLRSIVRLDPGSPLAAIADLRTEGWGLQGSYGMSESFTIFATLPTDAPRELRVETNGRPLPGNRLRIVDPATGREQAQGSPGEIAIQGATLMRGYYKQAPETSFDADGYFRTGDGGFIDADGLLHWTGRLSNLIKTGGANVSPVEIEEQLRNYQPLRAAIAVGVPHPDLDEIVVLCAVRRADLAPVSEGEVRAWLRERLSAYKVPRAVLFFSESELSFTANQKIQVAPLRERALARLREEAREVAGHRYA
jgi:acyl-CoA synthetase (AMP-forming)/AMP-acid ligase II